MNITFEQLPQAVSGLFSKLDNIERLLLERTKKSEEEDRWMNLKELISYNPEMLSRYTYYSLVSKNEIPFHKRGKRLIFLKSEIDEWLRAGRQKTSSEIQREAHTYLKKNKKG